MIRLPAILPLAAVLACAHLSAQTFEKVPLGIGEPEEKEEVKLEVTAVKEAKKETRKLRIINDFKTPPFSFKKGMGYDGFEVDLGKALAKELRVDLEWIYKGFNINTYASMLDMGSADAAVSSISITGDREKKLAFTRPYYRASLAVATFRDRDWKKQYFRNGMKDDLVGVVRGTTGESWVIKNITGKRKTFSSPERLVQALRDSKFEKVKKGLTKEEAIEALRDKKDVTAIVFDGGILDGILSKHSYPIKIVESGFEKEDYGIAVSRENAGLLRELNAALKRLDKTGEYDKIYEKWFGKKKNLPKWASKAY